MGNTASSASERKNGITEPRDQLGCTIQICWTAGLVGRKGHNAFNLLINAGINQIHGAVYVGFDALERVIFCSRHDFGRSRVDDEINTIERTRETVFVSHITDEETYSVVIAI